MVSPIDYTTDVLDPIQGYLSGIKFGEGLKTDRLAQEQTRQNMGFAQQTADIQQQTFDTNQQISQENRALAQQQRARAEAGRDALIGYVNGLEAGTATAADLRRGVIAFPQLAESFTALESSVSGERFARELTNNKQLAFSLANNNVDAARQLIETRLEAAKASGDERAAAGLQAQMMQLDQNPNGLLMQTLLPLVGTMSPDEFDKFHNETLGLGSQETDPLSSIAKLRVDLNNGIITQEDFDGAVDKMDGSGVTVTNVIGDAEGTLAKELSKGNAKKINDSITAGMQGSRRLRDLETLGKLFEQVDTGASASVKSALGRYGIKTEGVDLIQAASALISRLVPTAREPGSGPMSDKDLQLFQKTFPSVINTPEGNALILKTLQEISQYEIAEGMISGKIADWAMTPKADRADLEAKGFILSPQNGRKAIFELPKVLFSASAPEGTGDVVPSVSNSRENFMRDPRIMALPEARRENAWKDYQENAN